MQQLGCWGLQQRFVLPTPLSEQRKGLMPKDGLCESTRACTITPPCEPHYPLMQVGRAGAGAAHRGDSEGGAGIH